MTTRLGRWPSLLGRAAVVGFAVAIDLLIWDGDRQLRAGGLLPYPVVPVVTVLVHATLLLRSRHPRRALLLQLAFALASTLVVPDFQPFAGLLVALHAVASRRPPRESVLWLASTAVPFGVQSYSTSTGVVGSAAQARTFGALLLLQMLVGLAVWGVGRLSYAAGQRAWRLRELQAAEAAEAARAERLRLARELHDTVSHAVTAMLLQAAGAQAELQPSDERLRRSLSVIEATGVQAMSELHRMLGLLNSVDPDAGLLPSGQGPTVSDIVTLVALAQEAGRDVHLVQDGTPGPLDPSVEVAAYRVVQEALTNSSKHAGPASAVTVRLDWGQDRLEVTVTDHRRGPALSPEQAALLSSGHGLQGLDERVTLTGGSLTCGPTAAGFEVAARLPRPRSAPVLRAAADVAR